MVCKAIFTFLSVLTPLVFERFSPVSKRNDATHTAAPRVESTVGYDRPPSLYNDVSVADWNQMVDSTSGEARETHPRVEEIRPRVAAPVLLAPRQSRFEF